MNWWKKALLLCVISTLIGAIIVLISLMIPTIIFWVELDTAKYPDNTTYLGSNITLLDCYPRNQVKSVKVNKTVTTIVFTQQRTKLKDAIFESQLKPSLIGNIDIKFNSTVHLNYYGADYPVCVADKGYMLYELSQVEIKQKLPCPFQFFIFNDYVEYRNFFSDNEHKAFNATCVDLKNSTTTTVNYTLPMRGCYYFTAKVTEGVSLSITAQGSTSVYDNEKLTTEDCSSRNVCSVKIADRAIATSTDNSYKCVLAQLGNGEINELMLISVDKVKGTSVTVGLSVGFSIAFGVVFAAFAVVAIIGFILCETKLKTANDQEHRQTQMPEEESLRPADATGTADEYPCPAYQPGQNRSQEEKTFAKKSDKGSSFRRHDYSCLPLAESINENEKNKKLVTGHDIPLRLFRLTQSSSSQQKALAQQ